MKKKQMLKQIKLQRKIINGQNAKMMADIEWIRNELAVATSEIAFTQEMISKITPVKQTIISTEWQKNPLIPPYEITCEQNTSEQEEE